MKVSKVVLAAITATVVASSCTKKAEVTPTPNQQNTANQQGASVDTITSPHIAVDTTSLCLACGRG